MAVCQRKTRLKTLIVSRRVRVHKALIQSHGVNARSLRSELRERLFLAMSDLEHVHVCWGERHVGLIPYFVDLVGLGVEVGDLYQGIAHFNVVVMVVTHKA